MHGQCYQIGTFRGFTPDSVDRFVPMEADRAGKLDSKYGINLDDFYNSAENCQLVHPGFDGDLDTVPLTEGPGSVPECFWSVPVLSGSGSPCDVVVEQRVGNIPERLGITDGACTPFEQGPHSGRPGGIGRV